MRHLRLGMRLTQEELAKRIGVSQVYISRIENGDIDGLTIRKIKRIAEVLGITPTMLLEVLIKGRKEC